MLQQPLALGADLVLHAATKGIAGHNDALLGVVAGSRELVDAMNADSGVALQSLKADGGMTANNLLMQI